MDRFARNSSEPETFSVCQVGRPAGPLAPVPKFLLEKQQRETGIPGTKSNNNNKIATRLKKPLGRRPRPRPGLGHFPAHSTGQSHQRFQGMSAPYLEHGHSFVRTTANHTSHPCDLKQKDSNKDKQNENLKQAASRIKETKEKQYEARNMKNV